VKRSNNIAITFFLATIYCFAIFHFSSSNEFQTLNDTPDTLSSKEKQIDFISASQSSIDYAINNLVIETSKTNTSAPNPLFFAEVFHSEKIISSTLKQYTNQSNLRQIRYRKNDFIFPFHYHW
jgi:hypothetical protein